jgi:hypothetical protein
MTKKLVQEISEYTASVGLYGHYNDQVDDWRWITFQSGAEIAKYWYGPTKKDDWYRWPGVVKRPPGAMTLGEVFDSFGRYYHHLRPHNISPDLRLPGMPDQPYRLVYGLFEETELGIRELNYRLDLNDPKWLESHKPKRSWWPFRRK